VETVIPADKQSLTAKTKNISVSKTSKMSHSSKNF